MISTSQTAVESNQAMTAHSVANGRSSHAVYGGHERVLHQTLIALGVGLQRGNTSNPAKPPPSVRRCLSKIQ